MKFAVKLEAENLIIDKFLKNLIYVSRILTTNAADPIY